MRTELWLVASVLLLAGCPGHLENPEQFLGPCFDPTTELFPQRCGVGDCHDSENPAGDLDLASPAVATRLVGVEAAGGDGTLVDPDAPEDSILWRKVSGGEPPYGSRMPEVGQPLSSYERQCVLEWIEEQEPGASAQP